MKLLQSGNSKLGAKMLMFNIPAAKEICGRKCPGCYSYKAYKIYPNVLPAQQLRYEASQKSTFVNDILLEIKRKRTPFKYIRWHGSAGEFYSQEYIDKVTEIAKNVPATTFYTYTKRINDFDFSRLAALPNFVLINSLQFNKLNYSKLEDAPKEAFICPSSKEVLCGETCTYCMTKTAQTNGVWFIKH